MARLDAVSKKTVQKIEQLAEIGHQGGQGWQEPLRRIPIRSLANVQFNEKQRLIELGGQRQKRYFFNVAMAKKFMQTFLVSDACKELVDSGKTTSIRDLYYITKHTIGDTRQNTFEEQDESDPIIEDLEVSLDSLREELHLFASRKGSMVGPVTIRDTGDTIDLRRMGSGGWAVPSIVEENVVQFGRTRPGTSCSSRRTPSGAASTRTSSGSGRSASSSTGGGQPPRGVRRMVQRLHGELKLPVYVLVDNDPWGFYIYSVHEAGLDQPGLRVDAHGGARGALRRALHLRQGQVPAAHERRHQDGRRRRRRARQMLAYPWFAEAVAAGDPGDGPLRR